MKAVKIAGIAMAVQFVAFQATAQETDIGAMFAAAQAEGKSVVEFVAQLTDIKTCNPKLAEQVVEFAVAQVAADPVKTEEVLRAVNTSCVDPDAVTTIAVANNIDPAVVANALQTATAAGPAAPAAGGAPLAAPIAAAPGGVGAGGGTGAGDDGVASGN